jgi:uncharacterized membrane protein
MFGRFDDRSSPADPARFEWLTRLEQIFPAHLGKRVFAVAAVALGAIGLYRGDFTVIWHPVPDTVPARTELAYCCSILFVVAGLAMQHAKTVHVAGLTLGALYVALSSGWVLRVIAYPSAIGTWLGVAEQWGLATGALAIAIGSRPGFSLAETSCRLAFGVFEIVFALGHFLSLPETIALTPPWLPPGPTFWALATGAAHALGGVALILNVFPILAARLLALMFMAFGLLVWLPRLIEASTGVVPWAGNAINLALIGAVLALGDLLSQANAERRRAPC